MHLCRPPDDEPDAELAPPERSPTLEVGRSAVAFSTEPARRRCASVAEVFRRPMTTRLVLFGAGGHGRVVLAACASAGDLEVVGFVDAARSGTIDGIPVLGDETVLPRLVERGITHGVVTVGAVKPASLRA